MIARILTGRADPNADRLRVCTVDAGSGAPVQVVCGAPNARARTSSRSFAPPGTYVPGKNMTLSVGTIRGVESHGMLCSGRRTRASATTMTASWSFRTDAPVGSLTRSMAGLGDPVIEINLTPNRPDCTSVHGIARDLAAAGIGTLKAETPPGVRGEGPCPVASIWPSNRRPAPGPGLRPCAWCAGSPTDRRRPGCRARLRAIGLRPDQCSGRHH